MGSVRYLNVKYTYVKLIHDIFPGKTGIAVKLFYVNP